MLLGGTCYTRKTKEIRVLVHNQIFECLVDMRNKRGWSFAYTTRKALNYYLKMKGYNLDL